MEDNKTQQDTQFSPGIVVNSIDVGVMETIYFTLYELTNLSFIK